MSTKASRPTRPRGRSLIWNKEDLFPSMIEAPEAVHRLVDQCHRLLTDFLQTFQREIGEVNFCHCPYAWAPPELGCWLSEDEAGSMNTAMFDAFCLPTMEATMNALLDMARPDTPFLFNLPDGKPEEVAPLFARLRNRCPQHNCNTPVNNVWVG